MRASILLRAVSPLMLGGLLSGCSSGAPTAPGDGPSTTLQITTGPQVLRVLPQSPCRLPNAAPILYTAVTVTGAGSEWMARATSVAAGDVELRIRVLSSNPAATLVTGTITGTAVHMPEIAGGPPVGETRVNFGSDGGSALNGVIFPVTPGSPTGALDGTGTGAIALIDASGGSCSATAFSWMLFPQP